MSVLLQSMLFYLTIFVWLAIILVYFFLRPHCFSGDTGLIQGFTYSRRVSTSLCWQGWHWPPGIPFHLLNDRKSRDLLCILIGKMWKLLYNSLLSFFTINFPEFIWLVSPLKWSSGTWLAEACFLPIGAVVSTAQS